MKKPFWFDNLLNFLTGDFFETYAIAYVLAVAPFMYLSLFYAPPQEPDGIFNAIFLLVILSGTFFLPALGIALRFHLFSFLRFLKLIGVVIAGGLLWLVISSIVWLPIGLISFPLLLATINGLPEIIPTILLAPPALLFTFISLLSIGLGITVLIKRVFALRFSKKWQLIVGTVIGFLILIGLIVYLISSNRFVEDHTIGLLFGFGLSWSYGAAFLGAWDAIRESTKLSKAT